MGNPPSQAQALVKPPEGDLGGGKNYDYISKPTSYLYQGERNAKEQ